MRASAMPPALCYLCGGRAKTLCSPHGTLRPITRHLTSCPLPTAMLWSDSLFAISAGAACCWAPRQTSALKREGRSHAEPESGEPSPASGCLVRAGPGPQRSTMSRLLPLLLLAALGCAAKVKQRPATWDDRADAERPPAKGCANLTVVLDNWKFAITSQMRNLLMFDHQNVLPDYGRIRSLSGALDDLYRDFSALKEQLGRLSARFAEVEAFVDQLSRTHGPGAPPRRRGLPQPARSPPDTPPRAPAHGGGTARRAPA
ncbi:uncharacterized protein LOC142065453 isoform X1 [Phalacrocorax aristotelis]|uniref:uncharacterized protein LOC142065453 isoform X1 n=1 Tax=Phalacrocorax aristotelis TaxID=126867 RepID=UPI003F4B4822